jgi:serine/threonine protein kinase
MTNAHDDEEEFLREDQFQKLHLIGRGGFSDVYLVRHLETGLVCSMKIIRKDLIMKADKLRGVKTER